MAGVDADLIVDNRLIDVKVSTTAWPASDWAYHLLGYALLDLDDVLGIERVDEAAQSPVDLSALRAAFRGVLGLQGGDVAC